MQHIAVAPSVESSESTGAIAIFHAQCNFETRSKKGDTLYDSPNAYRPWDLSNFRCCIDITSAAPAQPPNGKDRTERNSGVVIFDVLVPDATKSKLIPHTVKAMTQDDFVRMLITGPPDDWGFL